MAHAHVRSKNATFSCCGLELPIHYDVDVGSCCYGLSVYKLACLQLVHEGVLHQELEHSLTQFLEQRVAQPYIFQHKIALDITFAGEIFIPFHHLFHRFVCSLDIVVRSFMDLQLLWLFLKIFELFLAALTLFYGFDEFFVLRVDTQLALA